MSPFTEQKLRYIDGELKSGGSGHVASFPIQTQLQNWCSKIVLLKLPWGKTSLPPTHHGLPLSENRKIKRMARKRRSCAWMAQQWQMALNVSECLLFASTPLLSGAEQRQAKPALRRANAPHSTLAPA